jgi:hypothetical protein
MNAEQIKSAIRWFVATFGGMIAGWFAAKGWFTVDQVLTVLNSPTVIATAASLIAGAWGLVTHSKSNAVAIVDAMPEVAGVVTKPTVGGVALAKAVPSATVTPAGTTAARSLASGSGVTGL